MLIMPLEAEAPCAFLCDVNGFTDALLSFYGFVGHQPNFFNSSSSLTLGIHFSWASLDLFLFSNLSATPALTKNPVLPYCVPSWGVADSSGILKRTLLQTTPMSEIHSQKHQFIAWGSFHVSFLQFSKAMKINNACLLHPTIATRKQ